MYTVRQILQKKGNQVWTVAPQTTVYQALELMAKHNIGSLIVTANDQIQGIFSERDYARKVILVGRSSKTSTVGDLMTKDVLYVQPDDTIEDCMGLMTTKRCRHLPVLADGKLTGVISIGDVVKAIIDDREITIRELERYITGGHTSR